MAVIFPDYSARESIIETRGNVELLIKVDKKIMRFNKILWGEEDSKVYYEMITAYMTGRVLNIGLGMGNSADVILAQPAVTQYLAYEIEADIVAIYNNQNPSLDPRKRIEVKDGLALTRY